MSLGIERNKFPVEVVEIRAGDRLRRDEYDIVVLGGGPAGYATALYGAAAGLNIAVVEEVRVGGTCLNRGCIPAKELLETELLAQLLGRCH
jgi:pyruvate/2-oxoglutarate dehydrogenase complex dihydrolipoamide dehydrogenase (E3) component